MVTDPLIGRYLDRGWPIFPCRADDKHPLTEHGFKDATTDPAIVVRWFQQRPGALIGVPTGTPSGTVVLDVDIKRPNEYGLDTLADLGLVILPDTPMVHT